MRVYCVTSSEYDTVWCVFSTNELAQDYIDRHKDVEFYIRSYVVDTFTDLAKGN